MHGDSACGVRWTDGVVAPPFPLFECRLVSLNSTVHIIGLSRVVPRLWPDRERATAARRPLASSKYGCAVALPIHVPDP